MENQLSGAWDGLFRRTDFSLRKRNPWVRARSPDGTGRGRSDSVRSFQQILFTDAGTRKGIGKHDQLTEEDKHP